MHQLLVWSDLKEIDMMVFFLFLFFLCKLWFHIFVKSDDKLPGVWNNILHISYEDILDILDMVYICLGGDCTGIVISFRFETP